MRCLWFFSLPSLYLFLFLSFLMTVVGVSRVISEWIHQFLWAERASPSPTWFPLRTTDEDHMWSDLSVPRQRRGGRVHLNSDAARSAVDRATKRPFLMVFHNVQHLMRTNGDAKNDKNLNSDHICVLSLQKLHCVRVFSCRMGTFCGTTKEVTLCLCCSFLIFICMLLYLACQQVVVPQPI